MGTQKPLKVTRVSKSVLFKLQCVYESPEDLIKMLVQTQEVWGGAWESAFLAAATWCWCFCGPNVWVPGFWIILTGDPGHRSTLLFRRSGEEKWLPQDYRVNVSAPKALHNCAHPPDSFPYSPCALNSATVLSFLQPFHTLCSLININMHLKKRSSGSYPRPHTEGSLGAPKSSHSHSWKLHCVTSG